MKYIPLPKMIRVATFFLLFLTLSPAFFVHNIQSSNATSKDICGNTLDKNYNISSFNNTANGFKFSKFNSSFNVERGIMLRITKKRSLP